MAMLSAILVACGGGGGGGGAPAGGSGNGDGNTTGGTTGGTNGSRPPLVMAGIVALGRALPGATVLARCSTGSGSATTDAQGAYSIRIDDARLPCVLQASKDGTVLHSVADGTPADAGSAAGGWNITVNISTLTELVTAQALGALPSVGFANPELIPQDRLTTERVNASVASVASALRGRVEMGSTHPIHDTLVAATAGTPGNALDLQLDALQAALTASQTTLAQLTQLLIDTDGAAGPTQNQLAPASASCPALHSGSYWVITPNSTVRLTQLSIDAPTHTVTQDGRSFTMRHDGQCVFSGDVDATGGDVRLMVGASGVAVLHFSYLSGPNSGQADYSILVPVQATPSAALAGTWNFIHHRLQAGTALARYGTLGIDAEGARVTGYDACSRTGVCAAASTLPALGRHADGGFTLTWANEAPLRLIAHQGPSGQVSLYEVATDTYSLGLYTRQATLPLPELGATTNTRQFTVSNGFAAPLNADQWVIAARDAGANTFVRRSNSERRDFTLHNNTPRTGLQQRDLNACTFNGSVNPCSGLIRMAVADTGLSLYMATDQAFVGLWMDQALDATGRLNCADGSTPSFGACPASANWQTVWSDNFSQATLSAARWTVSNLDNRTAQPAYAIDSGRLRVDVAGGGDGFMGVSDGIVFKPATGAISGDFEVVLRADELLREQLGGHKDNSGLTLELGSARIGIAGNHSGYWEGLGYNVYNKHRLLATGTDGATCLIDESLGLSTLYGLELRIQRVAGAAKMGFRLAGATAWTEAACALPASAELSLVFWSGDGGNTRANGRFVGAVDDLVVRKPQN